MYKEALSILNEISTLGYDAYIIGGYVRDYLLGNNNNDIDICTNATPDIIKNNFEVIKDNSKYGNLLIKYNNYEFEITTFRIELEYSNRYPKIIYTDLLIEDLKRRDFTINTICIDKNENIIDLLNGKRDLENKIIKCIGNPIKKIKEDPIRILRAIRFSSKYNFELEKNLENIIINYAYLLKNITKNQIKKEVEKMNKDAIILIKKYNIDKYMKGMI